jgi:site-specific recombinase XerD
MKEEFIATVLEKMGNHISPEQATVLEWTLSVILDDYQMEKESHEIVPYDGNAEKIVRRFLTVKHLAGCSEHTVKTYQFHLQKLALNLRCPLQDLDTNDLRCFLAAYKEKRKVSNVTLENMRLCLSSFFGWLYEEGLIKKNPMRRIGRIKADKVIKKPFSGEEMERIRMNCQRERDLAILEFLYSTGVRVSEAVRLNRDQINFNQSECVVFGKGAKERVVYLNSKACIHLREYLDSRTDDNPALFVGIKKPHQRLSKEGIEAILRGIGRSSGVDHVHPHRFRRTMATNALNRGMPVQEVRQLLGHEKMDTTMIYCTVSQEGVRLSHKKYIA